MRLWIGWDGIGLIKSHHTKADVSWRCHRSKRAVVSSVQPRCPDLDAQPNPQDANPHHHQPQLPHQPGSRHRRSCPVPCPWLCWMRPRSLGVPPPLSSSSSSGRRRPKDRRHPILGRAPLLLVVVLLVGLLRVASGAAASAPAGTSVPSAPRSSSSHSSSNMASEASLPPPSPPPQPQPQPSSSSAAAQARLLEVQAQPHKPTLSITSPHCPLTPHANTTRPSQLDRLCERLAQRLRWAEDRLYPHHQAAAPAKADGVTQTHRPPRVIFRYAMPRSLVRPSVSAYTAPRHAHTHTHTSLHPTPATWTGRCCTSGARCWRRATRCCRRQKRSCRRGLRRWRPP